MDAKITGEPKAWVSGKVKGFMGKSLMDLDNGTVKLVRVDAQSSYPLHRHLDKTEYAYVIAGDFQFTINNKTHSGVPGDFFIFKVGTRHAINNQTNKTGMLLIGAIKEN